MPKQDRSTRGTLSELRKREIALERQLAKVQDTIDRLLVIIGERKPATRKKPAARRLSAAGRAAISRAAKRRWAKYRKEQRGS